jgi:hypothetical protein
MRLFWFRALLIVILLCAGLPPDRLSGQEPAPQDIRFKILEVKKAYFKLEEEKARYERARELLAKDLISREEFHDIEAAYKTADVNYTSALLEFLYDQPHVMVEEAVKYQGPGGERRVRLKIRNTSGEAFQLEKLPIPPQDDFFRDLQWRNLTNVFVSLKLGETIISQPYEAMLPVLEYDRSETIDFGLLRDVDEVVVSVSFADKSVEKKVFLQKDSSANIVSVVSSKFSQEADLGKSATYDLRLERFTADDNVFRLRVVNLPAQIEYEFIDPNTRAKLTQIKFTEGVTTQNLLLKLYLPERSDKEVRIDRPLSFYVLVGDGEEDGIPAGSEGGGVRIDPADIEGMRLGWVELELIPRGIGEIEVRAQNLYHEIDPGETVSMDIVVRNVGTRRLDNIILETDLPYDWRSSISPDRIDVLLPDKEHSVRVVFYPPEGLGMGDYEAKIRTNAMASNRPVETEDKRVRIHVRPASSLLGNLLLGLSIVGILLAMVIFGVRLSRR